MSVVYSLQYEAYLLPINFYLDYVRETTQVIVLYKKNYKREAKRVSKFLLYFNICFSGSGGGGKLLDLLKNCVVFVAKKSESLT